MADMLLDTAFFIDLRRRQNPGTFALWQQVRSGLSTAAYSPVTVYELWVGQRFDREEEAFYKAMFLLLSEAPLTSAAAELAGQWMRQEPSRPEELARDALIAATADQRGEVVRTRNLRDFQLFPVRVETY